MGTFRIRALHAQGTGGIQAGAVQAGTENSGTHIEDVVLSFKMPELYTPFKDQQVKAALWLKGIKGPQSEQGRCAQYIVEQETGERTLGYLAGVAVESETDAQQLSMLKNALDTYQKDNAPLPPAMQMFADQPSIAGQPSQLSPAQFLEFVRTVTDSYFYPHSRRREGISN